MTMNTSDKKTAVRRWYFRPAICVTAGLFLAGLSYAVVMQWQRKNLEAQVVHLQQSLEQEKEKTLQAEALRKEKRTMPEYLHRQLECLRELSAANANKLEETRTGAQKLKELDTVKEYLSQAKQLHEMKEQNQKLYQQVEEKKKRYQTLKKELQEG